MKIHLFSAVALFLFVSMAAAQQSDNHVLHAVPAPGAVSVDGKTDDWDTSGQIEIFANYRTRSTYSAKVSAMYDKDHFYLLLQWRDPTPLQNMVDANFQVGDGWKSDCVQLRMRTDAPLSIDCWYSTTAQKPVINIAYGTFNAKSPMQMDKVKSFPQKNAIDAGAKEAVRMGEDNKSYIQEIALPWKLITAQNMFYKATGEPLGPPREFKAGDKFNLGIELLWGGPDGRTFPIHRYADLVREGSNSREFFWENEAGWGTVALELHGQLNLPAPDYASRMEGYLQKTAGPVKLSYTMPFDGYATLAIDNEHGQRVRNLIGMAPRSNGMQVDFWDCTDDNGHVVTPGTYHVRGLMHQGIEPTYEATYGTPGVPPWDTGDGTGAWLSDHTPPRCVAMSKDQMILAAERGESGYAVIGVDMDGRKKWGDRTFHGIDRIAADDDHVYILESAWDIPTPTIGRMEAATGTYAPFQTASGGSLRVPILRKGEKKVWSPGMAVGPEKIALALAGETPEKPREGAKPKPPETLIRPNAVIRFFDKKTGAMLNDIEVPNLGAIAYDAKGALFVWSDSKLSKLDGEKLTPVIDDPDQKYPQGLAVGSDGTIYIGDSETNQVRVYSSDGKFQQAIGKAGGRAERGAWEPDGMLNIASVAIDPQHRIWVAEMTNDPRRVSVWGQDGKLIRDFIGPTGYGGMGANADPDDKTRLFGSGCEFHVDYDKNTATVAYVLGDVSGELLKANGREYIMTRSGRLYLRDGDQLRFVAAIGNPYLKDYAQFKEMNLPAAPKGTHGYTTLSFVWSDNNDDGKVEPDELVTGSGWTGWSVLKYPVGPSGEFGGYWLDNDFNIYGMARESYGSNGGRGPFITKIPIQGWTAGGAPIWNVADQKVLREGGNGGTQYLPSGGMFIAGSPITGTNDDGKKMWTYPDRWAGVHASHDAPIPERDDTLVGTLGCVGRVKTPVGTVFGMNSNMGRLYLMTTDGLFVGSVFQDTRLGSDPWPTHARRGAPLGGVTMGSEWFGGHLFQSVKTNETYLVAGFTAYNLIKLNGLDKLQAIPDSLLSVSPKDVQDSEKMRQQLATESAKSNALVIATVNKKPPLEGKLTGFAPSSFVAWSSGPYSVKAAMAVDDQNLYLAYNVTGDDNPMVNGGKDINQLFITGDSVDLQLRTNPDAKSAGGEAAVGDLRLLISVLDKKPVAVLYRWKTDGEKKPVEFSSPWRSTTVDSVQQLNDVKIKITPRQSGYIVEAAVPLSALNFKPEGGKSYRADLGAIFSDPTGTNRAARVYWSNKATGLTSDVPGEIMAAPGTWGKATVAGK